MTQGQSPGAGRFSGWQRRVGGYALVVVAILVQTVTVTTGAGFRPGAAAAAGISALGLLQGGLLLARRRWPGQVLIAICAAYAVQAALAGVVAPAAAWVGITALPMARRTRPVLLAAVVTLATGMALGSRRNPGSAGGIPLLAAITVIVVLTSAVIAAAQARTDALIGQAAETRQRIATEERLSLARELHDSIGHGLSTIAVQSSAARMALDAGQDASARRALAAVESSSRAALNEMRDLVTVLRGVDAEFSPSAGISELPELIQRVRDSGVAAQLELATGLEELPAGTQATIYRIVQEGLTNVVRHAPGAWAHVRVAREDGCVLVNVADGGGKSGARGPERDGHSSGWGLLGLRERAQLMGGWLDAGPAATPSAESQTPTGWTVRARLPVADPVEQPRGKT